MSAPASLKLATAWDVGFGRDGNRQRGRQCGIGGQFSRQQDEHGRPVIIRAGPNSTASPASCVDVVWAAAGRRPHPALLTTK